MFALEIPIDRRRLFSLKGTVVDLKKRKNKRLLCQKISIIRWLGANRPVAGAQAPKPAGSEANRAHRLSRAAGFEPESQAQRCALSPLHYWCSSKTNDACIFRL
jgi:hypothetical protein